MFSIWVGLELYFGELSPQKPPPPWRQDWLQYSHYYKQVTFLTTYHTGENVGQKQLNIFHGL